MNKIIIAITLLFTSFFATAQQENSLYFDNLDDVVICPGASGLIANSNQLSMTFWVYPENGAPAYPDYDGFAGFRNNTNADFYVLQLTTYGIEARFRNSAGANFDVLFTGLLLNTWQHFALVYDGSTLSLYHNGSLAGSVAASGTISNTADPLYIGMTPWTPDNFYTNGKVDEVSLWNKALTPSEIACMQTGAVDPSTANLQLYYRFNQGTAGGSNVAVNTLTDATGSINGNLTGFTLSGTISNWVGGVALPNSSLLADTICPGATYIFGGQTITQPGTYFEAFPGSGTCDSVVQLVLTSPVINTGVSQIGPVLTSLQTGAGYQWIDCLNGNAAIAGATAQTFTATANGQYAVVVTMGGCADTSNCINVINVGLSDAVGNSGFYASNPFTDELNIILPEHTMGMTYQVTDVSGRVVSTGIVKQSNLSITTGTWSKGIYSFSVEGSSQRLRLLKQ